MATDSRPNILFVFADQLRGQDLGCAGNTDVQTPTIDRLAAEGVRCTHAYTNSPVCTPARGMMLTGQYPLQNLAVVNDLPLSENVPTVSGILRDAGYRTGYIGKWHLDGVPRKKFTPPGPRRHGFDFWAAYNCSHDYFRPDKVFRDAEDPELQDGYEPKVQTDIACEFLAETANDDRPFCLFVSWGPPHDPYDQVPEEYRARYDPSAIALRPNVADISADVNPLAARLDKRRTMADYYAAITALDDQLAVLLQRLDEIGAADNTIVVFSSDHGDMLWSHGRMKKQQPWEESISVPFIVRWPDGLPRGEVVDGLTSLVDVTPTLLSLVDVEPPVELAGRDLSGVLRGSEPGPDSVFLMDIVPADEAQVQGISEWRGVRTARYTYAVHLEHSGWVLYDNETDPYQLTNLIDDPAYAEVRSELDAELRRWLDRVDDPFVDGLEHLRRLGLAELWNAREHELHPTDGRERLL